MTSSMTSQWRNFQVCKSCRRAMRIAPPVVIHRRVAASSCLKSRLFAGHGLPADSSVKSVYAYCKCIIDSLMTMITTMNNDDKWRREESSRQLFTFRDENFDAVSQVAHCIFCAINNLSIRSYLDSSRSVSFLEWSRGGSMARCYRIKYTLCLKKRPTFTICYNFYIDCSIATIFGINVAEKAGNQNVLYFPTTPN